MKRIKHRIFKHHIDLIKYAVKRAILRCAVVKLMKSTEQKQFKRYAKKHNWLEWAKQKLRETR